MPDYEIGLAFSTTSEYAVQSFYAEFKELLNKYIYLFDQIPPLESYDSGEEPEEEYDDDDDDY
jgi:hypothetical protein